MARRYYNPHTGGIKITPGVQAKVEEIAEAYAKTRLWYPKYQLKLRFKGQFCYLDACSTEDNQLFPLCRLRHFGEDSWSLAFFAYSNERYEPCIFHNNEWCGTIEQAIDVCEMYLSD